MLDRKKTKVIFFLNSQSLINFFNVKSLNCFNEIVSKIVVVNIEDNQVHDGLITLIFRIDEVKRVQYF